MTTVNIALFCDALIEDEYLNAITSLNQFKLTGYWASAPIGRLEKLEIPYFANQEVLIDRVDAIVLALPAAQQFEIAKATIKNCKHLYIEKPFTSNIDQVDLLLSMQREADVKIQLGAGLRLNEGYLKSNQTPLKPHYLETQNLRSSGIDTSVVLDMMIHDIDIILQLTRSEVRKISAHAVCVYNDTPDMVNARIEFGNGCVASLTANRLAKIPLHTLQAFQKNKATTINFLSSNYPLPDENLQRSILEGTNLDNNQSSSPESTLNRQLHIVQNLISFYESITQNSVPPITLNDGYKALKIAYQIIDKIEERQMES